jgi:hypothetical protein
LFFLKLALLDCEKHNSEQNIAAAEERPVFSSTALPHHPHPSESNFLSLFVIFVMSLKAFLVEMSVLPHKE